MLNSMLGLPDDPFAVFLMLCVGGVGYYFLLAALFYGYLFKVRKAKYHPTHVPDAAHNRRSMKWSVISILGNAVLTAPIHWAVANGYSQVYYDITAHSLWWIPAQMALVLVISETAIYWTHRALHSDLLYHRVHGVHHSFKVTTSWSGVAFNPLDSFAQGLPHHLCLFLFPMHVGIYLTFLAFVTMWAVMIHDRVSWVRWAGINYTGHHTLHHWFSDYNYGQFFTAWDRLMGTYRHPETARDEMPADVFAAS
jgi:lathosterol oxidase